MTNKKTQPSYKTLLEDFLQNHTRCDQDDKDTIGIAQVRLHHFMAHLRDSGYDTTPKDVTRGLTEDGTTFNKTKMRYAKQRGRLLIAVGIPKTIAINMLSGLTNYINSIRE